MIVLDTCALIEATQLQPSFSHEALEHIAKGATILSISFAEIACKIKQGKLVLSISTKNLYQQFSQIHNLNIVNIGITEWLDSIELEWHENKDPADRIITAFAIKNHYSIVTTDLKIKKFYNNVIW